jgi:hypothetical protein
VLFQYRSRSAGTGYITAMPILFPTAISSAKFIAHR